MPIPFSQAIEDALFELFVLMAEEANTGNYIKYGAKKGSEWTEGSIRNDLKNSWNGNPDEQDDIWLTPAGLESHRAAYDAIRAIARKGDGKDDKRLRKYYDIPKGKKKGFFNKVLKVTKAVGGGIADFATSPVGGALLSVGAAFLTAGASLGVQAAVTAGVGATSTAVGQYRDNADKAKESVAAVRFDAPAMRVDPIQLREDLIPEIKLIPKIEKNPNSLLVQNFIPENIAVKETGAAILANNTAGMGSIGKSAVAYVLNPTNIPAETKTYAPDNSKSGMTAARTGDALALTVGVGGCAASFGFSLFIPMLWFSYRILTV